MIGSFIGTGTANTIHHSVRGKKEQKILGPVEIYSPTSCLSDCLCLPLLAAALSFAPIPLINLLYNSCRVNSLPLIHHFYATLCSYLYLYMD